MPDLAVRCSENSFLCGLSTIVFTVSVHRALDQFKQVVSSQVTIRALHSALAVEPPRQRLLQWRPATSLANPISKRFHSANFSQLDSSKFALQSAFKR